MSSSPPLGIVRKREEEESPEVDAKRRKVDEEEEEGEIRSSDEEDKDKAPLDKEESPGDLVLPASSTQESREGSSQDGGQRLRVSSSQASDLSLPSSSGHEPSDPSDAAAATSSSTSSLAASSAATASSSAAPTSSPSPSTAKPAPKEPLTEEEKRRLKERRRMEQEKEDREKMLVLVSNFTEGQLDRYEMFRRAAFPKAAIKRVMQGITGSSIGQNVVISMAGISKVFVGEVIEIALDYMERIGESGPLKPKHLREAARVLRERGKLPRTRPKLDLA